MTRPQETPARQELLALVSRLELVETQLAEGRPYAASSTVAVARAAVARLVDELADPAGQLPAVQAQDAQLAS